MGRLKVQKFIYGCSGFHVDGNLMPLSSCDKCILIHCLVPVLSGTGSLKQLLAETVRFTLARMVSNFAKYRIVGKISKQRTSWGPSATSGIAKFEFPPRNFVTDRAEQSREGERERERKERVQTPQWISVRLPRSLSDKGQRFFIRGATSARADPPLNPRTRRGNLIAAARTPCVFVPFQLSSLALLIPRY